LRPREARKDWQRGSARCQMQEFATGKFHDCAFPMCRPQGATSS